MVVNSKRKRYPKRMVTKRSISAKTLEGVGARLRMVRAVLGHTQADWARALKITRHVLNKWEQGTGQPNLDILILICASTGCTLDFIFRGRVGLDMRQELRDALLRSYAESKHVFPLFSPTEPPPSPSPSRPRRRS
jgi:DNA-binding XRE family transcriptional regulator